MVTQKRVFFFFFFGLFRQTRGGWGGGGGSTRLHNVDSIHGMLHFGIGIDIGQQHLVDNVSKLAHLDVHNLLQRARDLVIHLRRGMRSTLVVFRCWTVEFFSFANLKKLIQVVVSHSSTH